MSIINIVWIWYILHALEGRKEESEGGMKERKNGRKEGRKE